MDFQREANVMRVPRVRGVIDRRILVNFRVDPEVVQLQLPPPFKPMIHRESAIAGICLIRLKQIRPVGTPAWFGIGSENAAHRIAVVWPDGDELRCGVYIPRRDTSSRLNVLLGGRVFPGVHHHAEFEVEESAKRFNIRMRSDDGNAHLSFDGSVATDLPGQSTFENVEAASRFFEKGSLGYSATAHPGHFHGLELRSHRWSVQPLEVHAVTSGFFENQDKFPSGTVQFDSALLMRGIEHEWVAHKPLCCHDQSELLIRCG
jgi:hypothetical protein